MKLSQWAQQTIDSSKLFIHVEATLWMQVEMQQAVLQLDDRE